MNTAFLLMAQFNKAIVPLEQISKDYFALEPRTAANYAKAGKLPVPAFRGGEGNKAPWLVNVNDLAAYLDKQRDEAKKDQIHNRAA
ncbi:pyocin activator PrtN family protein [Shewanella acanthi]|uniref:pyocin activator PrtN family protein n=1 Tax=Shewanella acanthi TaxID=2864212 RepID=UPI001C660A84|nr:pyocin activator PrtN family protein [Shewanella acanthi]QYJ79403.1 pyocin activator PrtN family protein [Shewanella acanthi]